MHFLTFRKWVNPITLTCCIFWVPLCIEIIIIHFVSENLRQHVAASVVMAMTVAYPRSRVRTQRHNLFYVFLSTNDAFHFLHISGEMIPFNNGSLHGFVHPTARPFQTNFTKSDTTNIVQVHFLYSFSVSSSLTSWDVEHVGVRSKGFKKIIYVQYSYIHFCMF